MTYQLGIDLGTTFTAAAIADADGVRMAALTHDGIAIPSVVTRTADGIAVGTEALTVAATRPWLVAREFKRRFGDETPFIIGDDRWTASELTGLLYTWVFDHVAAVEGSVPEHVVVTHPATWSVHRLGLLADATSGRDAPCSFLPEPSAAAVHYHERSRMEPGSTIAVYDLGGGTFDATVVRRSNDGYEILGRPAGLEQLGGLDFDQVVFDLVVESMPEVFEDLDPDDLNVQRSVARLREECTRAKIALSFDARTAVPVVLPGVVSDVLIARSDFEERIEPYVSSSIATLDETIRTADMTAEDLTAILLVGGSSRVPMVAERLFSALGVDVVVDTHPKFAVAKGAVLSQVDHPSASTPTPPPPSLDIEPSVMPDATVDITALVAASSSPRLVIVSGPSAGTAFALAEGATTIGRSPDRADLVVPDPAASRLHLRIDRSGMELQLTDLGSTAGTKVDRVGVVGSLPIKSGSLIEMGSTWLLIDDPLRRSATPGAVVLELAPEPQPRSIGRPGHGWATLGFGGEPLAPVHLPLLGATTDLAVPGTLGKDLLRSLVTELLVLEPSLPVAVLTDDVSGWLFAETVCVSDPSAIADTVLDHGVLVIVRDGFADDALAPLRERAGSGGVVWLHEPPSAWPGAEQLIRMDPTTAAIEVISSAAHLVVDVPVTLGKSAVDAVDLSRPRPSP